LNLQKAITRALQTVGQISLRALTRAPHLLAKMCRNTGKIHHLIPLRKHLVVSEVRTFLNTTSYCCNICIVFISLETEITRD